MRFAAPRPLLVAAACSTSYCNCYSFLHLDSHHQQVFHATEAIIKDSVWLKDPFNGLIRRLRVFCDNLSAIQLIKIQAYYEKPSTFVRGCECGQNSYCCQFG